MTLMCTVLLALKGCKKLAQVGSEEPTGEALREPR